MGAEVALVTGGSSGIGEITARQLHDAGFTVYAAARRTDKMVDLEQAGVRTAMLDVTDAASARRAVEEIVAESGGIDVLVNNAGYGSYGAVEDAPLTEAQAQLDVNVLGLARMAQLVLPGMRERGSGTIINISSMGGRFVTPLGGWYHASKYAVEALSDAMRLELAPFGVDVVVIEPGSIRSAWGAIAAEKVRRASGSGPYAWQADAVAKTLDASARPDFRAGSDPEVVAHAVVKAAGARRPRSRYAIGRGSALAIALSTVLPDRVFDRLIARAFGIRR